MAKVSCNNCGEYFYKRPSRITLTNFCSNKCQGQFATATKLFNIDKIECVCLYCNNLVLLLPCEYKKKITKNKNR